MSDDQVAELMQKVIAGVEARNALIEAAFEATKGTAVAKKMARFEQSGQDCRNDAAIKAMNQLHTLKNQTFNGLCAWMVRILINAIFEHDRRMDVRKTEELLIEPTTDSPSIGTQVANAEQKARLRACLKTLNEFDQNLVLMKSAGKTFVEIGEALGLSARDARYAYVCAKDEIAACLGE